MIMNYGKLLKRQYLSYELEGKKRTYVNKKI